MSVPLNQQSPSLTVSETPQQAQILRAHPDMASLLALRWCQGQGVYSCCIFFGGAEVFLGLLPRQTFYHLSHSTTPSLRFLKLLYFLKLPAWI
jgi:hypothetical protein